MSINASKIFQKHSFWLVVLCHLLLLLSLSLKWVPESSADIQAELKEKSAQYVSSYVYKQSETKPITQQQTPAKTIPKAIPKKVLTSKNGYKKPVQTKPLRVQDPSQLNAVPLTNNNEEPVHLLGDKNNIAKPLIILLGKALTAHLTYPKLAIDFNLRGVVVVKFLLYPDGHITNVKLSKTSQVGVLDESVLAAINAMGPIYHVNMYLDKPKLLEIGVVFE